MSVAIADIPSFISKAGGVQEIRLSKSITYKSPKAKAATAQERLEHMDKLAVVKTEALSKLANPENIGEHCVLLAKQEADGSLTVKALITNTGAVNAAFAAAYQAEKAVIDQEEKELKKANKNQSPDARLKIAA
jgi:type I restriction-modification system DNA methylase subunit